MIKSVLIFATIIFVVGFAFYVGGTFGQSFVRRTNNYLVRNVRRILGIRHSVDLIYPVITDSRIRALHSAIKLSFVGDLILLREAVERAHVGNGEYDFSPMFKYVKPYFDSSDCVFGVFEGPAAGCERPFSTSNRGDGIPLHNNFPDSYVKAIKEAGIDFVTTANNHLLDCGVDGAMRTLDVLDSYGIDHVGSYRNKEEHSAVKLITIRGKRVAVLAYTYGSEYCNEKYSFEKNQSITRLLVPKKSRYFSMCKKMVKADFAAAKACAPDLIVVMPHMGAEFSHIPDKNQRFWAHYYVELGADVVLADHPHTVQPIEWVQHPNGRNAVIVYCPGNYINCYTYNDGDASMIAEIYLDPHTCNPFAVGVVPVYTYGRQDANYTGVPVYDFMTRVEFAAGNVSIADWKRCAEVNQIVVKASLGVTLPIDNLQDRYYDFVGSGYCRQLVRGFKRSDLPKHGVLIDAIEDACCVCFVGDSITEGTKNGGYGWYEPLMRAFPSKCVCRVAKSAQGIRYFVDHVDELVATHADLYVIAVGSRDVRGRDVEERDGAADEYIAMAKMMVGKIKIKNALAKFVFIAPWESAEFDPWNNFNLKEKAARYRYYERSIELFCEQNGCAFVNPNPRIRKALMSDRPFSVLKDYIHPNAAKGIELYSKACAEY